MPFVAVDDGVELYYTEASPASTGRRVPLVLVHAFPMSHAMWSPQLTRFGGERRTIAYDCRGFGRSSAPASPDAYSQERSVEDLRGLLDGLGIARAVLVGLSMGGSIALNFAFRYPDRVAGLCLAATGAGSDDPAGFAREVAQWADSAERAATEGFLGVLNRHPIFGLFMARGEVERRLLREIVSGHMAHGIANTARRTLARRPPVYALEDGLRRVTCPTTVIVGERDPSCRTTSDFLAATVPRARLVVVPEAGHFVNLEAPFAFDAALAELLAEAEAAEGLERATYE